MFKYKFRFVKSKRYSNFITYNFSCVLKMLTYRTQYLYTCRGDYGGVVQSFFIDENRTTRWWTDKHLGPLKFKAVLLLLNQNTLPFCYYECLLIYLLKIKSICFSIKASARLTQRFLLPVKIGVLFIFGQGITI